MGTLLFHLHSGWRYVVIVILIAAIAKMLIGWLTNSKWSKLDQGLGATTPLIIDIQLLLGIVLLFTRLPVARTPRFMEHFTIMLLAIVVAHVGWARVKKSDVAADKFRTATIGFLVAGLFVGLGVARITGVM